MELWHTETEAQHMLARLAQWCVRQGVRALGECGGLGVEALELEDAATT